MTRYIILFDDGDMTFPEEDLPDVAKTERDVEKEAVDAGMWVFNDAGGVYIIDAADLEMALASVMSASTTSTFESLSASSTACGSGYHEALPAWTVPKMYARLVSEVTSHR